jgi:hypothetical protein
LLAGGFLLGVWMPLPFVLAGGIVLAATLVQRPVVRLQSEAVHTETPEAVALRIL